MHLRVSLFIAFILTSSLAYSQQLFVNGLGISLGASIPVGSYGSSKITKSSSGFANPGPAASISYSHHIRNNFGFSALLQGQLNPLDTRSLESSFSKQPVSNITIVAYSDPSIPPPSPTGTVYPNWKFKKKSWWSTSLLGGVYKQFSTTKKISVIINGLIGAAYVHSPEVYGSSITDTASAIITQSKGHGIGLAFQANAGLRYSLSAKSLFVINLGYYSTSSITFKDIVAMITTSKGTFGSPNYSVAGAMHTGNAKETLSSLNLSAGIVFKL